ncbi:MAG: preprotein translocase subunit YajC [Alphaproteobacteria bacterium]|nr:preprotein translocase subunit YajC [Alphaproteobacteria bacterium]MCL2889790.1 preprotein translocase subunit YajC [Alphaproteobacteria bacterium]
MENVVVNVIEPVSDAMPKSDFWGMMLYVVVIFAVLYFFMILPNKRRMKEYKNMLSKLAVGNKILCAGGIYGVIKKIDGEKIQVEIAKGVVIDIPKSAVANIE